MGRWGRGGGCSAALSCFEHLRRRHPSRGHSQGFVKNILDVADNLERAAASVPADALAEGSQADTAQLRKLLKGLLEGVAATEKILLHVSSVQGTLCFRRERRRCARGATLSARPVITTQVLKQNGVEQYNPVDQKFDPNMHNALFEMPVPEGSNKEVGSVAAVTKVSSAWGQGVGAWVTMLAPSHLRPCSRGCPWLWWCAAGVQDARARHPASGRRRVPGLRSDPVLLRPTQRMVLTSAAFALVSATCCWRGGWRVPSQEDSSERWPDEWLRGGMATNTRSTVPGTRQKQRA